MLAEKGKSKKVKFFLQIKNIYPKVVESNIVFVKIRRIDFTKLRF